MTKNEYFSLNMREKMAISVYLGKIKKRYTITHFTILRDRGILTKDGNITTIGKRFLNQWNGDQPYDRREVPNGQSASKKRRRKRK